MEEEKKKKINKNKGTVNLIDMQLLKKRVKILKFQNTLSGEKSKHDIRKIKKGIARELTLLNSKKNNKQDNYAEDK